MKKFLVIGGLVIALLAGLRWWQTGNSGGTLASGSLKGQTAVLYKSPTCGCCGNYAEYLRRNGVAVEVKETKDMDAVKQEFGVPKELESCHTTKIGGYTVEGHVPVEAIEKLLAEKPAGSGIGLPDMPDGTPGMPGRKNEPWDIRLFSSSTDDLPLFVRI